MKFKLYIILVSILFLIGCTTGQVIKQPVCNKPYILVGSDCCLDKDDNSICDEDEIKEELKVEVKEGPKVETVTEQETRSSEKITETKTEEKKEEPEVEEVEKPEVEEVVKEITKTTNEVKILGKEGFEPMELTIARGSTVTWSNKDQKAMILIMYKDGALYLSQRINPKREFEHKFIKAGKYDYWWNIAYSSQAAKIIVN